MRGQFVTMNGNAWTIHGKCVENGRTVRGHCFRYGYTRLTEDMTTTYQTRVISYRLFTPYDDAVLYGSK